MILWLEQHDEEKKDGAKEEPEGVGLYGTVLEALDEIARLVGSPSQEVEEAVDDVAVKPSDGGADAGEDDAVRDELVNLVHVETLVSPTVETGSCCVHLVGNRLLFALEYPCGEQDAAYGDDGADTCNRGVEVYGVRYAACADDAAETCPFPVKETA